MVVQRYIHNPLLVDGFKFDLRVYVIVIGTSPLTAFVCEEGLARFCTVKTHKFNKLVSIGEIREAYTRQFQKVLHASD